MQTLVQDRQEVRPPPTRPEGEAPLVLRLHEVTPAQRTWVGGKAANLALMLQAGLPVPSGFCITTAAFELFMDSRPRREALAAMMAGLSADRPEPIATFSRQMRECFQEASLPPSVQDAVLAAWRDFGAERGYAVRSSAPVEDGQIRSFAGQFESILDVRGAEALLDAIKACWLSLFSVRALTYQASHGVPALKPAMAVLVQPWITADFSGVAFTADPRTGATDAIVVESVAGCGEALVQGRARPAIIRLRKTPPEALALPPFKTGVDMPSAHLSGPELQQLLNLAMRTERLFGEPQDIEWAQRDGALFLLQSRPITTRSRAPAAAGAGAIWSNVNTTENFQDVVAPMAWSFVESCFRRITSPLLVGMGIDPASEPLLGLVAGRVYMNVTTARRILLSIPGFWGSELGPLFGGYQDAIPPVDEPNRTEVRDGRSVWMRLRGMVQVMGFIWRRITWASRTTYLARLNDNLTLFVGVDGRRLSDDALAQHLFRLLEFGYTDFRLPGRLGFGLGACLVFRRCCAKWLGDANGALANQLISRAGGMASAEAALDLWRLAVWTAQQPETVRRLVLTDQSFARLADALGASHAGRAWVLRWETFMARHGHRARGEIDLAVPRWSETPDEVLRMLRHYLASLGQLDLLQVLDQRSRERERLLAESRARLRHPLQRWVFGLLLRQAQVGLVYRENLKSELLKVVAYVRRLLLELGERMTRAGLLDNRDDIFFLTLEEIQPARQGPGTFAARPVIRARRAAFLRNQAITPPPIVVGEFDPAQPPAPTPDLNATVLHGLAVSAGVVTGRARVILSADTHEKVLPGEILVAPYTDPGWTPLFLTAAGLVVDLGGLLSHGSVVAREYGLPAVVNVPSATQIIHTGQLLQVDGNHGIVTLLSDP